MQEVILPKDAKAKVKSKIQRNEENAEDDVTKPIIFLFEILN